MVKTKTHISVPNHKTAHSHQRPTSGTKGRIHVLRENPILLGGRYVHERNRRLTQGHRFLWGPLEYLKFTAGSDVVPCTDRIGHCDGEEWCGET